MVINNKQLWSGADNSAARTKAAQGINAMISRYKFKPGESLNIIGHSHGGNVGIQVSQLGNRKMDNLVTLGTPVRSDYQPNYNMIATHVNAYSSFDPIQVMGGGQTTLSTVRGLARYGALGAIGGWYQGRGEFGPAGVPSVGPRISMRRGWPGTTC